MVRGCAVAFVELYVRETTWWEGVLLPLWSCMFSLKRNNMVRGCAVAFVELYV
jgi:hypothetical protein